MSETELTHTQRVVLSAVHPLADVRRRAVQALDFKVKHGLVDIADVIKASAQGI